MKGRIIGIEPVDYASKKTGEQVKGVRLIIACKSQFQSTPSPRRETAKYHNKSLFIQEKIVIF